MDGIRDETENETGNKSGRTDDAELWLSLSPCKRCPKGKPWTENSDIISSAELPVYN